MATPMDRMRELAITFRNAAPGEATTLAWWELDRYVEAMVLLAASERRLPVAGDECALLSLMEPKPLSR